MNTILTPIKWAIILGCALLGMTQAMQTRVGLSRHSGANGARIQRFFAVRSLMGFPVAVLLASCGGGGGGPTTYTVGGMVTGLAGSGLVLRDNGGDNLAVSAARSFTFATKIATGAAYNVSVHTQPTSPSQTCVVTSGSGTMGSSNVTNVAVACTTNTYTISGTVSGLNSGAQVTLQNNASDSTTLNANGPFTFATPVSYNGGYSVTVVTQPAGQACTVTGGTGSNVVANVLGVSIACGSTTAWSPLYSFLGGAADGATPVAELIQGSDGNFYGTTFYGGNAGIGTVFKITPAGVESVLHSFQGSPADGYNPTARLIQGSDGNFYGTTFSGGPTYSGTVFKITPAGVESVLHSFLFQNGDGDGIAPYAGLIQGSDGNFYGTTAGGGAAGSGTVFKITPAGVESVLYSFQGGAADGLYPLAGLIQGSDGNFYGMTPYGGNALLGTVFKITPAGVESLLYSFQAGGADGETPYGGLIQGSDGNFYGTTTFGGTTDSGTVFKITPAGVESVLHSFQGGAADGATPVAGLIQGSDGNFYGTTANGGTTDTGTVFKITPAGVESVLHSFQGVDGNRPSSGLIQGSDGNFYGTTTFGGATDSGTVFKF